MNDEDKLWVEQTLGQLQARNRQRFLAALIESDKDVDAVAEAVFKRLAAKNAALEAVGGPDITIVGIRDVPPAEETSE